MKKFILLARTTLLRLQILFLTLFVSSFLVMNTAHAVLLMEANFESGEYASAGLKASGSVPIVMNKTPNPVCSGTYSAKLEIGSNVQVPYRSELVLYKGSAETLTYGGEYWVGFSIYIPDTWIDDGSHDIVMQLHGRADTKLGEPDLNPSFTIYIENQAIRYSYKTDSKQVSSKSSYAASGIGDLGTVKRGQWNDFVVNMKISYNTDGFIKIWRDNTLLASYTGGTAYNDQVGPYFKFGNYKPKWRIDSNVTGPRIHYIDNIRIGNANSSFNEVAPNCQNNGEMAPPSGLIIMSNP